MRENWNGSGEMTKQVKICLDGLRRGLTQKSHVKKFQRRDKAEMEKLRAEPGESMYLEMFLKVYHYPNGCI